MSFELVEATYCLYHIYEHTRKYDNLYVYPINDFHHYVYARLIDS